MEELEKTKEAIKQLIQDAAVRTRKEVGRFTWLSREEHEQILQTSSTITLKEEKKKKYSPEK